MVINHNIASVNAQRNMNVNSSSASKSMTKLASGLKINGASDDAAGLAISEKMRGQIRGLDQASSNAQDGISMIQTAEGALNETTSILQRMRELSVQASNDTATTSDRQEVQKEMNQLIDEVDRISTDTEFNTQKLLNGDINNKKLQIGANENQEMTITISAMGSLNMGTAGVEKATVTTTGLDFSTTNSTLTIGNTAITIDADYTGDAKGLASKLNAAFSNTEGVTVTANGADIVFTGTTSFTVDADADNNGFLAAGSASAGATTGATIKSLQDNVLGGTTGVQTQTNAKASITAVDNAIKTVSGERAKLGAYQNRLEHTISNLGTSSENMTSAESRIRDVDMAKEMSTYTKNNILAQAAQSMIAQANQQPQQVLQLLQ